MCVCVWRPVHHRHLPRCGCPLPSSWKTTQTNTIRIGGTVGPTTKGHSSQQSSRFGVRCHRVVHITRDTVPTEQGRIVSFRPSRWWECVIFFRSPPPDKLYRLHPIRFKIPRVRIELEFIEDPFFLPCCAEEVFAVVVVVVVLEDNHAQRDG